MPRGRMLYFRTGCCTPPPGDCQIDSCEALSLVKVVRARLWDGLPLKQFRELGPVFEGGRDDS